MKTIKLLFTIVYPIFAVVASILIILYQTKFGVSLGWMGVLLTTSPLMIVNAGSYIFQNNTRPTGNLPLFIFIAFIGFGLTSIEYFQAPHQNLLTLASVLFGVLSLIVYKLWLCPSEEKNSQRVTSETYMSELDLYATFYNCR